MVEPEQIELLRELVAASESVSRDDRMFFVFSTMQVDVLQGPINRELSPAETHDLWDLIDGGLLRLRDQNVSGTFSFTVAPAAREFLDETDQAKPLERVEREIVGTFIDGERFRTEYPGAYESWAEAAALLWGGNPEKQLTTIGHKTREALQKFAEILVSRNSLSIDIPPTHTVARLRAVVDAHRDRLGEARHQLLDALISYWGAVNDLIQRQEHGGQKEGEPLSIDDGRQAVFQSAVVMYELDRTLG